MTADDYTTAAREEARRAWWDDRYRDMNQYPPLAFAQHMAEWALVYLTQQEPDDAEVEAAARVLAGLDITIAGRPADEEQAVRDARWDRLVLDEERAPYLTRARAALRAARDVRGQA